MKTIIITLLAIFGLAQGMTAGNPKIVAHRGYWKTEGSAQNSIRSLVKADSIGVYGSEFDVWLSADDKLIVNHDGRIGDIVIEKLYSCTDNGLQAGERRERAHAGAVS